MRGKGKEKLKKKTEQQEIDGISLDWDLRRLIGIDGLELYI